jgi:beta-lactamase regulating signal transducer with metallopeptidase domain
MPSSFVLAMSESLAAWLVRTSWQALVLVVIVAGVQWVFGKLLSPRWKYALWMLVVVRLLMPVTPASRWSVFNTPVPRVPLAASRIDTREAAKPQGTDGVTVRIVKTFDGDVASAPDDSAKVAVAPATFDWRRALLAVWLAGAILLVLRFIIAHVLLTRRLRGAPNADGEVTALLDDCRREMGVRGDVRVVATDAVGGPALFGFVRPKLLVPPAMLRDLSRDDLRFVFLHELAHLKRRDTLLNIPLSLAAALHWFNPAVWFALSRCRTERELACDAMVLEVTDSPGAQQGYGQTMLRLAEALCAPGGRGRRPRAVPAALGILQTRSQLNRRITMISAFRRSSSSSSSRRWSVLPAVLLVGVASCALTDKASSEGPATQPSATAAADDLAPATFERKNAVESRPEGTQSSPPAAAAVDVSTARASRALDRRIADLNLDAKPFSDVIEQLRGDSDLDIFVNWRALEAAGIDRAAPVTARLRNAKFSKVLQVVLDEVGGDTIKMGYSIDDGVLTITTAEDLNRNTLTKIYDIRDLIAEVPDYAPPGEPKAEPKPRPTTEPEQSLTEQIVTLIQETVEPDAWRDQGGSVASIRELSGQFIITATPQMHEQIVNLLHQLREARGVQVSVEARFIAITPALLDKALGGKLRGTLAKSSEATVWQLTDAQVDAVLREAQQAENSTLLTAPRITLFNGQRAHVTVSTETAYVSGFTIFKKEGGETRYEPKIGTAQSGILLDVRATASADRRQAVLTLKPKLSRLVALRVAPYMDAKDLSIQVPEFVVHELQTTLSIPDRGTALIGGFTVSDAAKTLTATVDADQILLEDGVAQTKVQVPDGGKVLLQPIRPAGKQHNELPQSVVPELRGGQTLYLLVKPTVIVTEPPQSKQFPILSTKP